MRIRKLLNGSVCCLVGVTVTLWSPVRADSIQGIQYGVQADLLQSISPLKHGLWHSNIHFKIPSLAKHPDCWMISGGTGLRTLLTPSFILGVYSSIGQLNHGTSQSYWLSPSAEFWFPSVKIGVNGYFLIGQSISSAKPHAVDPASISKQAFDIKVSSTYFPSFRPFLASHYLHNADSNPVKPFQVAWGIEWLMTTQCTLEIQNSIGQSNCFVQLKLHSVKLNHAASKRNVLRYLKEPVDQYSIPIMALHAPYVEKEPVVAEQVESAVQTDDVLLGQLGKHNSLLLSDQQSLDAFHAAFFPSIGPTQPIHKPAMVNGPLASPDRHDPKVLSTALTAIPKKTPLVKIQQAQSDGVVPTRANVAGKPASNRSPVLHQQTSPTRKKSAAGLPSTARAPGVMNANINAAPRPRRSPPAPPAVKQASVDRRNSAPRVPAVVPPPTNNKDYRNSLLSPTKPNGLDTRRGSSTDSNYSLVPSDFGQDDTLPVHTSPDTLKEEMKPHS